MAVLKIYRAKVLKMIRLMIQEKLFINKIRSLVQIKIRKDILQIQMKLLDINRSRFKRRIIISKFLKELE